MFVGLKNIEYKEYMKEIFVSGTCRATNVVYDGREKITAIHSQRFFDAPNINFLGNFTNVKGHIQFIKIDIKL